MKNSQAGQKYLVTGGHLALGANFGQMALAQNDDQRLATLTTAVNFSM